MNKQALLQYVNKKFQKKENKPIKVGDGIRVHVKIKEGNTTRVQVFEGTVISKKGAGSSEVFTVRKLSFGVGVERIFPLNSPTIQKIQIVRSGHVRRAKLYYLRARVGKSARLEEKEKQEADVKKSSKTEPKKANDQVQELVTAQEK